MLLILFGPPGVGKSFIGRIFRDDLQFHFYDADSDLTDEMLSMIARKETFTQAMRDEYTQLVINKIQILSKQYKNLVIAQALAIEKNRLFLQQMFPHAQFVYVEASIEKANQRLLKRRDGISVDIEYAEKIRNIFEKPALKHLLLDNNSGKEHVLEQLKTFGLL